MKTGSRRISDLLGYQPGWIIRNGNLLFLLFIILLLCGSRFVWYREKLAVPAIMHPVFDSSGTSTLSLTVPYHVAKQIRPGDKIEIPLKISFADSLFIQGEVASGNKLSPGAGNDSTIIVKISEEQKLPALLKQHENEIVNATVILSPQRLSGRLWKAASNIFTIDHH